MSHEEKRIMHLIELVFKKWQLQDKLRDAAFRLWGAAILLAAALGAWFAIF